MKSWKSSVYGDEERAFIQYRVAGFSSSVGGLFLAFGAFLLLRRWLVGEREVLSQVVLLLLAASLTFLVPWFFCRRGHRSILTIRGLEMGSLSVGCALLCWMSLSVSIHEAPGMVLTSVMAVALTARAVFVPSSFWRSLVLAYGAAIPIALAVYWNVLHIDRARWASVFPDIMSQTPTALALNNASVTVVWWLVPATLTALASKVIYGLRRQVRRAKQLGQYRLVRKLGEGGMGRVYEARHRLLRRPTAIKLIDPSAQQDDQLRRFEREVQLTASLVHPNVVAVFDYGHTQDGVFYYAMELVEGATLAELVAASGPQEPSRVVHLLHQAASALVEAHAAGLVHRDIKPANLMVHSARGVRDILKVLDFGLVKHVAGTDGDLSRSNLISGTPNYLSPEAISEPRAVGSASDIYALGCVAYFLLTGTEVFEGDTVLRICADHLHQAPMPPSRRLGRQLPAPLEELVLRCLEKDPADRPQSMAALCVAFEELPITRWTEADKITWWDRYGEGIAKQRSHSKAEGPLTIELARSATGEDKLSTTPE